MLSAPYTADRLHHPSPPDPPLGDARIHLITSAPPASLGSDGDEAHDINTGDDWLKYGGVWHLDSAGGSGGTNDVIGSFADPNGNVTPGNTAVAAWYIQDQAEPSNIWSWSVADQVWYQRIG